jgi:pyruvate dehydrogenase E1 component alpha subunit
MHIADVAAGNLGANGIVGGSFGIAVGAALVQQMKNTGVVVFCFFGDGAVNQGIFHESANLAAIWNLPVVFVCENNQYGMSFHYRKAMRHEQISQRAAGYGFPGVTVDGNDVLAVFRSARKARCYARQNGPMLLECVTYRWRGHSKSDANRYRTQKEINQWKARCPIKRFRQLLIKKGILSRKEVDKIDCHVSQEVDHALETAQKEDQAEPISIPDEVYA